METPDILNSKIKKIRIELPDYRFSHSSSGDSSQPFIGRERIREKLKKIVVDSPNEPGVYLVTGNRGVGKTCLVNEVINETSLSNDVGFLSKLKRLFNIKSYIKNHSRLYLRINFGHKLRDEKDILRLITRTLTTEYVRYRSSFWRMLPWRAIAISVLILSACLFNSSVEDSKSIEDWEGLSGVFSNIKDTVNIKVVTKVDTIVGTSKVFIKEETEVKTNISTRIGNFGLKVDQTVKQFLKLTYYRYWLPILLTYLLSILLFRCKWLIME